MRFALLAVLLLTGTAAAQHAGERHRTGAERPLSEYIGMMEDERRVSELQVAKVVEALGLKSDMKVADIGAGSGLFTRPLAEKIGGKGVVYAVEARQDLVDYLRRDARGRKLGNVRAMLGGGDDPRLPEPVDLIVVVDTLHHIGGKPEYVKNLRRYLRAGGRIAVVDLREDHFPEGHDEMRYTPADLDGWMRAAGLKRAESHDFLGGHFFVVYHKGKPRRGVD